MGGREPSRGAGALARRVRVDLGQDLAAELLERGDLTGDQGRLVAGRPGVVDRAGADAGGIEGSPPRALLGGEPQQVAGEATAVVVEGGRGRGGDVGRRG